MTFSEAVRSVVVEKYIEFSGRASRSEFWWFALASCLLNVFMEVLGFELLGFIVSLALLIPSIAVAVRRFHDLDRTGWWALTLLIPLVNLVIILIFFTRAGTAGTNRHGPDPLAGF